MESREKPRERMTRVFASSTFLDIKEEQSQ